MHELGVVFHIMDSLESVAKENDVTQIQSVTIEIGEVSTVIPHLNRLHTVSFRPNLNIRIILL